MQFTPKSQSPAEETVGSSLRNPPFFLLFGASVVIVALAVGAVFYLLWGGDEEREQTPRSTARAPTNQAVALDSSPEPVPRAATSVTPPRESNGSWQSEVIVYKTLEATTTSAASEASGAGRVEREAPPLLWTNEPPIEIEPTPYVPPPSDDTTPPDPPPVAEPTPLATIPDRRYTDCGTLAIPSGAGLFMFSLSASREPTVICLGESVGASCGHHSATIQSADAEDFTVLVTKKPDGTCAVGAELASDRVSLCSVKMLMDRAAGTDQTEAEWRTEFQNDPGGTFVDMYIGNQAAFADFEAGSRYGCEEFQID